MPVSLASYVIPKNGQSFFLLDDFYIKGGYHVCADIAARDAIYGVTKKIGMLVFTQADNKFWRYDATDTWIEKPVGVQGPVGPTGAQGSQGSQGVQGPVGPTGAQGVQGVQGVQGYSGASGTAGVQGPVGPTGPKGSTGITGPIGPTGNTGPVGPTGAQGSAGAQGAAGNAGTPSNPSFMFQYRDAIAPSVGTSRYYPRTTITVSKVALWVTGTASSQITVHILKNGLVVQVATLNAGQTISSVAANIVVTPADYLTCNVVGGGGTNLNVRLDY